MRICVGSGLERPEKRAPFSGDRSSWWIKAWRGLTPGQSLPDTHKMGTNSRFHHLSSRTQLCLFSTATRSPHSLFYELLFSWESRRITVQMNRTRGGGGHCLGSQKHHCRPSPLVLRKDPSCPVKTQSSPNTARPQPGFVFHGIIYKAIQ